MGAKPSKLRLTAEENTSASYIDSIIFVVGVPLAADACEISTSCQLKH